MIPQKYRSYLPRLVFLLGTFVLSGHALGQTAATDIADGRTALANHDIVTANTDFQLAVSGSATDEEANVLYAASQLFVLETGTGAQKILDSLGVSSSGRNIFTWTARLKKGGFPSNSALTSDTLKAYATNVLLPQLQQARQNLAVVTGTDFSTTLSTAEDGLADVTIDYGDVKVLEALADAAIAGIETGDTFNTFEKSTDVASWLKTNALSVQQMVAKYPALLTSSNSSYTQAFTSFNQSVSEYVTASDFIRSRTSVSNNLFSIDPDEVGAEAKLRNELVALQASVTGTASIGSTQVYLGALSSFSQSLRSLLPAFQENHAIAGTYPDLTFGGVLPGMTAAPVQQFFLQLGNGLDRFFHHDNSPKDVAITIKSPAKNGKILESSSPTVTAAGTAKAGVGVANVILALTDYKGQVQSATANGTTVWSSTFSSVTPGPNVLTAYAVDSAGIPSKIASRPFTYVKYESLPVSIVSGTTAGAAGGTVSAGFSPTSSRELESTYTIVAKPKPGYIFQSWTPQTGHVYDPFDYPGDTYYSTSPTYKFSMSDGLTLQANFIPSPFSTFAGRFATQVTFDGMNGTQTSGYLTITISNRGTFSATLTGGASPIRFGGQLNGLGAFSGTVSAGHGAQAYINLTAFDLQDPTQGFYFYESTFIHGVYAEYASGSPEQVPATNNVAGNYTLVIQADNSNTNSPQGNGWGTFSIQNDGDVTFVGKLADGTPVSFETALFNGYNGYAWDFSVPLYNGNGYIYGEMDPVTTGSNDFSGYLSWNSNGSSSGVFASGFFANPEAVTSPFVPAKPIISLNSSSANLEVATDPIANGGLSAGIDDIVTLSITNKITIPNTVTDGLSLSIQSTTGVFTGSFFDSGSGMTINFSGVVLQNQDSASGFFIGTSQSGLINLTPQ